MRRLAVILLAACGARTAAPVAHADLAIHDVRVFDGARALEHQTVLVDRGVIVAVGDAVAVPSTAQVIEGAGYTLLPGLVDAHAHVNLDDDPRTALAFGVTTEVDMMSSPEVSVKLARAGATDRARVVPAGYAATAPGGHGTEYGMAVPTLTKPDEAEAFVAARVADGSHHLKIIIETGVELGMPMPSLDAPTVKALVEAAHRHHLLAVAHVGSAADVTVALDAGIDGLVHVPAQALDAATIARIAKAHVFVAPTLTVLGAACGRHARLEKDPKLAPLVSPADAHQLAGSFPKMMARHLECDAPTAIVRALHAAGVPLLAGTDAPNPGTMHGLSVHDELARLVDAGLSPLEALVAGTSAAATAFELPDLGVIRRGATADLVLVAGDPTRDIAATRAIAFAWRAGIAVDVAARKREVEAAWRADAAQKLASRDKLGPLADFETDVRYGKLVASSDKLMGGTSTSATRVVAGGAAKTAHALEVTGTVVASGKNIGWAGVSFLPGDPPRTPVNLAALQHIRFWVRGDGKTYNLFVFAGPGLPAVEEIATTPAWTEIAIDATQLGVPLDAITGLTWAATTPGAFAFAIDQITLE